MLTIPPDAIAKAMIEHCGSIGKAYKTACQRYAQMDPTHFPRQSNYWRTVADLLMDHMEHEIALHQQRNKQ